MEYKGWLYDTELDAQDAVAAINAHFGTPVSPDAVTQTYTDYVPWGDAFAIIYEESIEAVLGAPVVLPEIPEPDGLDD